MIKYSIIIPVYNEEDNISILYQRIKKVMDKLNKPYEIIWVNDGSIDNSLNILKKLKEKDKVNRVISFKRNHGQTAAMDAGFRNAKGEIFITLDADLQNDPEDIPKMLKLLDEYDMVAGWRYKRQDNFIRRLSSKIANWIRNKLTYDNIADTGCSLKVYKRECLENIKLFEGLHRFLPTLIKNEGFKVTQMKVKHHPRKYGKSKYGVMNRAFKALKDLFAVRWMIQRSLRYKKDMEEL